MYESFIIFHNEFDGGDIVQNAKQKAKDIICKHTEEIPSILNGLQITNCKHKNIRKIIKALRKTFKPKGGKK